MRLYMSEKERDELFGLLGLNQKLLNCEDASAEDKQRAEDQIVIISGMLLSPLFPTGLARNVLMIGFFVLGVLAFITPYEWLFWSFFIGLAFSPRITGELARRFGAWFGRN